MIGGDFNSMYENWESRYTNTRGKIFKNSMLNNNIPFVSPDSPTYWQLPANTYPVIWDLFITKIPILFNISIINLNDISSVYIYIYHTSELLTYEGIPQLSSRPTLSSGSIQ